MAIVDNIFQLIKEKHKQQKDLAIFLNVSKATISDWKSGKNNSYTKFIPQIAEFLGVSIQEIYGNNSSSPAFSSDDMTNNVYPIPVYGSVSAGFGADANSQVLRYLYINIDNEYDKDDTLCIDVTGDSMYPNIMDGDTIQVRRQDDVDNGKVAAIMIDEDGYPEPRGYVKKVLKGKNFIELHSFNPKYEVMRFEDENLNRVHIVGIVQKVIRDL